MKACPHCGGEIRPSVIRCVHCGMSLAGEAQPAAAAAVQGRELASPATIGAPAAPAPAPVQTPAARPATSHAPAADPWVTPSVRADGHSPLPMPQTTPSPPLGSTSTRRPDHALLVAGVLAIAAAVAAYTALSLSWVTGRVSSIGTRGGVHPVADLTFRASDSFGGMIALAIAVVMTLLGLLWFWYGLDRAMRLPVFVHPAAAVVAGLVGGATIGASKLGSVFWEGAFVAHAREAGLTRESMQALLDDRTKTLVEIEQLSGSQRFGVAAGLAVVAGLAALWSQQRRGSR